MKIFYSLFLILILFSCEQKTSILDYPKDVKKALELAKTNRYELEKVIQHYANDSLKLAAAYFLIANMPGQAYYKAKLVDTSGTKVPFDVLNYSDYTHMVAAWDSIEKKIGKIDYTRDTVIYDLQVIKSDFLIKNIDLAFMAWESPWSEQLNFEQFCEYVLPYRGSNEPLEEWRENLYNQYTYLLDSIKNFNDPIEIAIKINNNLKSWYKFDARFYRHPTDLSYSQMKNYKMGRCEDMTNLAIFAMRSQGVPVMSDYVPYWPNTGNNHAWNATLDKKGKTVIFMGGLDNPYEYKLNNKKSKVYRKTFSIQKNNIASIAPKGESIPRWLSGKHYTDVTKDYIKVTNVNMKMQKKVPDSCHFAYLCVFNSGKWKAIEWGELKDNKATFKDMGMDIAYLPAYFRDSIIPSSPVFILNNKGEKIYYQADTINKIDISLYSTTHRTIVKTTDEIETSAFENNDKYILYYWDYQWKSIDTLISQKNQALHFKQIPSNALYWLIKKDGNKEERIFTINENGKQIWW